MKTPTTYQPTMEERKIPGRLSRFDVPLFPALVGIANQAGRRPADSGVSVRRDRPGSKLEDGDHRVGQEEQVSLL
jgi:hypothetical protein